MAVCLQCGSGCYVGSILFPFTHVADTILNSGIFGSLGSALVADKIGRKITLALALVISIIAITMEITATHRDVFFGGKLLNGLALGTFSTLMPGYIGEVRSRSSPLSAFSERAGLMI